MTKKELEDVPRIEIVEGVIRSNAARPTHVADTCACWKDEDAATARKLLRTETEVVCADATAFAAMTAMSLSILYRGKDVKAKLKKGWEASPAA